MSMRLSIKAAGCNIVLVSVDGSLFVIFSLSYFNSFYILGIFFEQFGDISSVVERICGLIACSLPSHFGCRRLHFIS